MLLAILAGALVGLAAMVLGVRLFSDKKNVVLILWFILLSHRSFIPRVNYEGSAGLFFLEIGIVLVTFAAATATLISSFGSLRLRISEGRTWLLLYTLFAGASLLWTPAPIYSGFWFIRLSCVALILTTYFANADLEDCKRFFTVTLLGSAPVLVLPVISFVTEEATAAFGSHRVTGGGWAHPGVVSIVAFAVAVACLTILLQRNDGRQISKRYLHLGLLCLALTSGFLAGGKAGAIGGAVAASLMLLLGGRLRLWFGMMLAGCLGYALYEYVLRDTDIGLVAHVQSYDFEQAKTLQGRFKLWFRALEIWSDSLPTTFFGRGFTAFRTDPLASPTGWDPGHAHNSFVNLLLDVGLMGALVFVTMLCRSIIGAILLAVQQGRQFSDSPAFPMFIALISLLVGSLTDDVFGGTLQPTTYLFIGIVIALDRVVYLSRLAWTDAHRSEPGGPIRKPLLLSLGR